MTGLLAAGTLIAFAVAGYLTAGRTLVAVHAAGWGAVWAVNAYHNGAPPLAPFALATSLAVGGAVMGLAAARWNGRSTAVAAGGIALGRSLDWQYLNGVHRLAQRYAPLLVAVVVVVSAASAYGRWRDMTTHGVHYGPPCLHAADDSHVRLRINGHIHGALHQILVQCDARAQPSVIPGLNGSISNGSAGPRSLASAASVGGYDEGSVVVGYAAGVRRVSIVFGAEGGGGPEIRTRDGTFALILPPQVYPSPFREAWGRHADLALTFPIYSTPNPSRSWLAYPTWDTILIGALLTAVAFLAAPVLVLDAVMLSVAAWILPLHAYAVIAAGLPCLPALVVAHLRLVNERARGRRPEDNPGT